MINTKLQIVAKEQAVKLRQLGFDWQTEYLFHTKSKEPFPSNGMGVYHKDTYFYAPTVALAMRWIREEKRINIDVNFHCVENKYWIGIYDYNKLIYSTDVLFTIHEDAELAGIDYSLNYLLNKKHE